MYQPTNRVVTVPRGVAYTERFVVYRGLGYVDLSAAVDIVLTVQRNYASDVMIQKSKNRGSILIESASVGSIAVSFGSQDFTDLAPNVPLYLLYSLGVDMGEGDVFVSHRGAFCSMPSVIVT